MKRWTISLIILGLLSLACVAYAASSFCVAGFGDAAVNGTWVDTGSTVNGSPVWQLGSLYVCNSGGGAPRWYLGEVSNLCNSTTAYYQTNANTSINPWDVPVGGWTDNGGGAPIGTTAVGACAAASAIPSIIQTIFFGDW